MLIFGLTKHPRDAHIPTTRREQQVSAWLKTFRDGNPLSPRQSPDDHAGIDDDEYFFLEPLSIGLDGSPKLTRHGEPMGRPSYEVGDLIGAYWSGSYEVRELWEVVDEPERTEESDWAWQTRVLRRDRGEHCVSLDELGIRPQTLARRVRLRLHDDQQIRLEEAFDLRADHVREADMTEQHADVAADAMTMASPSGVTKGAITLRLVVEHTPKTGSRLPDLGFDAAWLMKRVPELVFEDSNGRERRIKEKYTIVEATTSVWQASQGASAQG